MTPQEKVAFEQIKGHIEGLFQCLLAAQDQIQAEIKVVHPNWPNMKKGEMCDEIGAIVLIPTAFNALYRFRKKDPEKFFAVCKLLADMGSQDWMDEMTQFKA